MKDMQKHWLTWAILTAAVLAISLFFGVNYPMPEQPAAPPEQIDFPVQELGGNFSNPVDIEGTSSAAAPAITFEDDTDSGFFRSGADTLNISTGGTERLEIDSSALTIVPTLDADGPVDVDTSGSIDLTSTEAAANAIFLDANGTVTTGIDIDLGSVSGMSIDGGLVNIGGATPGVADGDNDVVIAAVLEVDGELELDGTLDADSTSNFADTANFAKGSGNALHISAGGELNNDGTLDQNSTSDFGGTATFSKGSDTALDVSSGGELNNDGTLDQNGTSNFADTATFSKGSGTALDVSSGGELNIDGTLDVNGVADFIVGTEHLGIPSVVSTAITYTAAAGGSGTVATIGNGEIWFIHDILVHCTAEFTTTAGDDEDLIIGDGNDEDGFLVLDHTDLTDTYNEGVTGHAAGWLGKIEANVGVYFDPDGTDGFHNNTFVYAPSGAAETIDWALTCTDDDCTAGAATIYVIYTRIQ